MMITLSIIAIIYGALVAMMQPDMKKLVAYSSVSHMGFVMLGMFALNPNGLNGSIIQQINHGISTGALFLDRRHHLRAAAHARDCAARRSVECHAGVCDRVPDHDDVLNRLAAVERVHRRVHDHDRRSSRKSLVGGCGGAGIVLGAAYMLWLYQRTMFGKLDNPANQNLTDMNLREMGNADSVDHHGVLDRFVSRSLLQGIGQAGEQTR